VPCAQLLGVERQRRAVLIVGRRRRVADQARQPQCAAAPRELALVAGQGLRDDRSRVLERFGRIEVEQAQIEIGALELSRAHQAPERSVRQVGQSVSASSAATAPRVTTSKRLSAKAAWANQACSTASARSVACSAWAGASAAGASAKHGRTSAAGTGSPACRARSTGGQVGVARPRPSLTLGGCEPARLHCAAVGGRAGWLSHATRYIEPTARRRRSQLRLRRRAHAQPFDPTERLPGGVGEPERDLAVALEAQLHAQARGAGSA